MRHSKVRALGAIGLPFYWLILASLAVVVVPWWLLVKGLIVLVGALARGLAAQPMRQGAPADLTRDDLRNDAERAAWDHAYAAALPQERPQAYWSGRR